MKTLIVLTDFSKTARNAANASLEIAMRLNADILLVNSYLMPFALFSVEGEGRSLIDLSIIASVSEAGLKKEARRLKSLLKSKTQVVKKPQINLLSSIESITETIKNINKTTQISMMIMGVHQTSLPEIFSAIDMNSLLNELSYPLLIIPKNNPGFPISNFVFATDFNKEDLPVLRRLTQLAKIFGFQTHVCHVTSPVFIPDFLAEEKALRFERHMAILSQGAIQFTELKGKNVAKELNRFNSTIGADMLGIIHHPHSLGYKLFHNGHTAKLIKHQKLPLLIFPGNFSESEDE